MAHRNTQRVVLNDTRWLAKVTYKSDSGPIGINYPFDNVEELTDLVEAAQERGRIVEIEILLSGRSGQASESWPWGAGKNLGGHAARLIAPNECPNFFNAAGYEPV